MRRSRPSCPRSCATARAAAARARCSTSSASATCWSTIRSTRSTRRSSGSCEEAAQDEHVLAIKLTLYRTSGDTAIVTRARGRGAGGQAGRGARRAAGALRRGEQHQLGAHAGALRRPRRVRAAGPQDALQDGARRAPRPGRRHPPLRAHRHRQLQLEDGAALHRRRAVHREPGDRRRPHRPVQHAHRLLAAAPVSQAARRARQPARPRARADRARGVARARRPTGAHHREDERARRSRGHRRALLGVAGGRRDRPHRARHLLPAARRAGRERPHPRDLDRRALPRALARLLLRQRRAARSTTSARPTGCRATSTAASRRWCPSRTRRCTSRWSAAADLPPRQPAGVGAARGRELRAAPSGP